MRLFRLLKIERNTVHLFVVTQLQNCFCKSKWSVVNLLISFSHGSLIFVPPLPSKAMKLGVGGVHYEEDLFLLLYFKLREGRGQFLIKIILYLTTDFCNLMTVLSREFSKS